MIYVFLKLFAALVVVVTLVVLMGGFWRMRQIQHDNRQAVFLNGSIPDPLPQGFYKGKVSGRELPWLGKKFDAEQSTGVNIFRGSSTTPNERYPFVVYKSKGITDKNLEVLRIDYNIFKNPWWLRLILDEIVQVAPNQYLGKVHLRIIPGFPFALAFFELQKE